MKKLIVFDLDGTFAESRSPLDTGMAKRLGDFLRIVKVAVISNGSWPQFETQVLSKGDFSRIGIARVKFNEAGDPSGIEHLGIALEHEQEQIKALKRSDKKDTLARSEGQ